MSIFKNLLFIVLFFSLSFCEEKDQPLIINNDCGDPNSFCQRIENTWYADCRYLYETHHTFYEGTYKSAPNIEGTYSVKGNILNVKVYKGEWSRTISSISADSIKFTDGTKWCSCQ